MNLEEFLSQAADHGPCVGVHAETRSPLEAPAGVEVRTIDGAQTKTLDALFDAFAEVWHFPPRFARNRDAFDD
jgi:Barstar (barnase inhibitor)